MSITITTLLLAEVFLLYLVTNRVAGRRKALVTMKCRSNKEKDKSVPSFARWPHSGSTFKGNR